MWGDDLDENMKNLISNFFELGNFIFWKIYSI